MALRNVGSSAKAKPEPSKYRQTSDDSMVNDVDADESMGGEPSADRPSEDAPEPYFEWWSAEDVPDFPESHRYMSHSARKALSKMMFLLLARLLELQSAPKASEGPLRSSRLTPSLRKWSGSTSKKGCPCSGGT